MKGRLGEGGEMLRTTAPAPSWPAENHDLFVNMWADLAAEVAITVRGLLAGDALVRVAAGALDAVSVCSAARGRIRQRKKQHPRAEA